jgi:hypothetical protein
METKISPGRESHSTRAAPQLNNMICYFQAFVVIAQTRGIP